MGLFGGGGGAQKASISRPDYIKNMINDLSSQVKSTSTPTWQNQQYAGLNEGQQAALDQLMASPQLHQYATQLMGAGEEGLSNLDTVSKQLQAAYGNQITGSDIDKMASQLYNQGQVQEAINAANRQTENQLATATNPEAAQQTMQQSGFGSSARLAKDQAARAALSQEQQNASDITNQAYQSAVEQAQGVLSGNRQTQLSALSGLQQNAAQQAGLLDTGSQAAQAAYRNSMNAAQQRQQNAQRQLDTQYNNAIGAQEMANQDIQNRINAASVMNGALGQTTTTKTSGGGSGILGGAMSGAAAGSAFGPWGALAGAVIGGAAGSQS